MEERKNKSWRKYENREFIDLWLEGKTSIEKLADKFGRTPKTIREHAYKLGLPCFTQCKSYICYKYITDSFGYDSKAAYSVFKTLPVVRRKIGKKIVYAVNEKVFWKWAVENRDKLDFSKYQSGSIGEEPKWLKEEMKISKRRSCEGWSKADDNMLITYYINGKSLQEIADKMGRTYNAIGHRASRLCKAGKLKSKKIWIKWTDEEVRQLQEMRSKGMTYEQCAYELGREMIHIADKLRRMKKIARLENENKLQAL